MTSQPTGFAPSPRSRSRSWLVALIAFLLGLSVMAVAVHQLLPRLRSQPATPAAAPASPPAQPAAPASTIPLLDARETALAARIATLEAQLRTLEADARTAGGQAGRAESLLVAFASRRALDRGQPLGYLEGELRRRFGATQPQAVATVLDAARRPVTLEDLRSALDTIAPALAAGDPNESWWQGVRREASQLVVIRRDAAPIATAADRLTAARRQLGAGQVEAALAEVTLMPGAGGAISWIEAAQRYVRSRRALVAIETAAIQPPAAPLP